jgi:streptomycin 6-kinase
VALTIPRYLAEAVELQRDHDRRPWLASLPGVVASLAEQWSLDVDEPFEPGGMSSWVAPARTADGQAVVLKVEWRHDEADHEAAALGLWDGDGAVRLLAAHELPETYAFVLERCLPGTFLRRGLPEPEQDVVIADVLRRLWVAPPPGHPFRPLQTMCDDWAAEFEKRAAGGFHTLDPGLERDGVAMWRALSGEVPDDVLLATDLHSMNVLAAQREPWLLIDPKPYVGDRHYDPLQHLFNCEQRLVADPVGLTRRMADLLDLDVDRLLRWLFARCVVVHEWWPMARDLAVRLAP